jgi:Mn-containing catalase
MLCATDSNRASIEPYLRPHPKRNCDEHQITGELDVDLRSNIAAEARAKFVYERLINFCDGAGTKEALQFLMTREITHMVFSIGKIAPTPGLMNQFFNDSTGAGDEGEIDTRGPWNEGGEWEFMASPALSTAEPDQETEIKTESSPLMPAEGINERTLMSVAKMPEPPRVCRRPLV